MENKGLNYVIPSSSFFLTFTRNDFLLKIFSPSQLEKLFMFIIYVYVYECMYVLWI